MVDDKNLCYGSVPKKARHALVAQGRRMSPRICSIPESKRPNYGPNNKRRMEAWKDKDSEKQLNLDNLVHILQGLCTDMALVTKRRKTVKSKKVALTSIGFYNPLLDKFGIGTFLKVKETLRLLNLYQLHSIEEEKKKCAKLDIDLQLSNHSNTKAHYKKGRRSKFPSSLPGLVNEDISRGQEEVCIPATNVVDNPPVAPSGFSYISSIQYANNVIVPSSAPGCNCKGRCTNHKSCSCGRLNGSDFPYVRQDGGRLFEPKDVVFECGPRCGCGPACVNRTSQRQLKYRLEVYRTKDKGWGVRSWDFIPSGAPVCEYTGIIRRTDELDNVSENDYYFEIDCWQTMNGIGARERRYRNVSVPSSNVVEKTKDGASESSPEFCIDAGQYGNVARFINHSCEPNLFVQCILSSHRDVRLARVVLFASDDIPPMQELTYDYNYELDSVIGPNGQIKKMPCNCGTSDCRKRLY